MNLWRYDMEKNFNYSEYDGNLCDGFRKYRREILNYDTILDYVPYYHEIREYLKNIKFISREEAFKYACDNYKNASFYKYLSDLAMDDEEIENVVVENALLKYDCLITGTLEYSVKHAINLCNLIEYIGKYPTTYPVPREDEKNADMEELMEKYDIIVRYYMNDDIDDMQILSDDLVRIVDNLNINLKVIREIINVISNNEWLLDRKMTGKQYIEEYLRIKSTLEFPISFYQANYGTSHREEAKKYIKRNHGNVI